MDIYQEFIRIAHVWQANGASYAVVGGIALAFHVQPRFTRDIDVLTTPDQLEGMKICLESLGYSETTSWTFNKAEITLHRFLRLEDGRPFLVDVLVGNDTRFRDIIVNAIPDEAGGAAVKVARKEDLIYLKSLRNSAQDKADIERLQDDETGKSA